MLDFRGQFLGARPPVGPSDLVPDPVEHRLLEIGQQRAFPPVFEALQFLKHLNEGLLNKIVGIGRMTGHRGQTTGGPACQRDPGAVMLMSTREMNITVGGGYSIMLDFQGQMPQDSQPADCSLLDTPTGCLWNWAEYPQQRTFTSDFTIQSNTLDAAGETELSNGLLGIAVGQSSPARLNMTITVPETAPGFWRFDFNPNIPPNGGAVPVQVVRTDRCTWTFSAVNGEKAALSILVKPPKGKQYAHREGLFSMPFVLTYRVPNCPA